jgi:hypothetical protein
MFRIVIIVEDKKLPQALTVLNGLCYNLEVAPVATDPATPREPKPRVNRGINNTEMIRTLIREQAAKDPNDNRVFSAPLVNMAADRWGAVKSSMYNAFIKLCTEGVLRRVPGQAGSFILDRSKL